jgi:hypothetical protein
MSEGTRYDGRYWLFLGDEDTIEGGLRDLWGTYDDLSEAKKDAISRDWDFWHIFDMEEKILVDRKDWM